MLTMGVAQSSSSFLAFITRSV